MPLDTPMKTIADHSVALKAGNAAKKPSPAASAPRKATAISMASAVT